MLKHLAQYGIAFTVLFFLGTHIHLYILDELKSTLSFALEKIYLFHFTFSLSICSLFLVLASFEKFHDQLGLIYLITPFAKALIFIVAFSNSIFNEILFSKVERLSLLAPVLLFLSFEVFFISKILKRL